MLSKMLGSGSFGQPRACTKEPFLALNAFRLFFRIYIAKDSEQGDRDVALKLEVKAQTENNQNVALSRSNNLRCCTPLGLRKVLGYFGNLQVRVSPVARTRSIRS